VTAPTITRLAPIVAILCLPIGCSNNAGTTTTTTGDTSGGATTSTSGGTTGAGSGSTSSSSGGTSGGGCATACRAGFSCDAPSGLCKSPAGVPQLSHVWIVVMENTSFADITSSNAPYLTGTIVPRGALMDHYFAVGHPSLPNYLAMVGGDTFGIASDGQASNASYQVSAQTPDIASQLEAAGLTWHEYSESQLTACELSDTGSDSTGAFVSKHDPMPHFLITQNGASCQSDDVSYDEQGSMPGMAADIDAGVFFNYVFISPNLCDDGHDSCAPLNSRVAQQDAWLSANLPLILGSSAYQANGLVIVTWDEDDNSGGDNQIVTVLLSPMLANPGQPDSTRYTHYSALATIESGFGLSNLPASLGHNDPPIADLWR
jgi:phosphatidylinositol-3-phosphatase